MQLGRLRQQIAPLFGTTDDALRVKQQMLYQSPTLREAGMIGRAGAAGDSGLLATHSASALLMLTAMLGGHSKDKIAPAIVRLWEAPPVSQTGHPLECCKSLGAALTMILQRADVRARLARIEVYHDVPQTDLIWDRGSKLIFAPFESARAWRRQVLEIAEAGRLGRISRLPRTTFDKVAKLIESEGTA